MKKPPISRLTGHIAERHAVIQTCLEMNGRGINQGTSGNVSLRIEEGFLITPSGLPYEEIAPEQIVEMDLDGGHRGKWRPSSEWRMHADIYRARPEAGAVVHCHSPHATALSCLGREIPAFHYMIAVAGGASLRCAPYATFGTKLLSCNMLAALHDRAACLLANHGMICFAADPKKALELACEIETLCQQYVIASQVGPPNILSPAEMARVLSLFESYGKQGEDSDKDPMGESKVQPRDAAPSGGNSPPRTKSLAYS